MPGVTLSGVHVSLQRLLALLQVKGRSRGFDLSSAVVPIVDVSRLIESEGGTMDALFPEDRNNAFVVASQAEVINAPVDQAGVQLQNPQSSGELYLVDQVLAELQVVTQIQLGVGSTLLAGAAALTGGVVPAPTNKRLGGPASTALIRQNRGGAAGVAGTFFYERQSGGQEPWPLIYGSPIIILPGGNLTVREVQIVNGVRFRATFHWRAFGLPL